MMYGIPIIDVPLVCTRLARSALPDAPVMDDEKKRLVRSGRRRRAAVGSRYG
jgi:hypothetical protein